MRKLFICLLTLLTVAACQSESDWSEPNPDPEVLHKSMKKITDVIVYDIFSPPVASRIYTYAAVACYEVALQGEPGFVSLAGQLRDMPPVPPLEKDKKYSLALASSQAMLRVGRALVFSEDKILEYHNALLKEFKDSGMPGAVYDRSVDYGNKVAEHVLAWASKDNYLQTRSFPKYSILEDPATWKPTPPGYMDAVEPHWNKIRPFVIDSAAQFAPPPPTQFSVDKGSQFYKEALEVHSIGVNLTQEQKDIASFWDCNPYMINVNGHVMFATKKISPGGHWVNITATVCRNSSATLAQSAEAYARVSVSLVDGFISCWDEKYRSRLIRPETYINKYIDENWIPYLQTPPFPEYTSGHSVISASAATALTKLFGETYAFADSTEIEFGLPARSFKSFYQASDEASVSRVYGGIHYFPAVNVGAQQGRTLGEFIAAKLKTRQGP
jgi:hypothetical protein